LPAATSKFAVVGLANILPADHVYVLPRGHTRPVAKIVIELAQHLPPDTENPEVPFPYQSYQRSGGGRVANILAYLGVHGHAVAACGVVGDDLSGTIVLEDLKNHGVNVAHVQTLAGELTRRIFIIRAPGSVGSHQVEDKVGKAESRFTESDFLPPSGVLLLTRANQAVLGLAKRAKATGTWIALHVVNLPRPGNASNKPDPFNQLVALADVLVLSRDAARDLAKRPLALSTGLVVTYRGINDITARIGDSAEYSVPSSPYVAVLDPTGMQDCFHGALLSFLLRYGWHPGDPDHGVVKAALAFANETAAFCGTGTGARHFPLSAQDELVKAKHWRSIDRRVAAFISHSSADREFVDRLRRRMNDEPRMKTWVNDALPGTLVSEAIRAALDASNVCILALSRSALDADWVAREIQIARASPHLTIVPIIIEPIKDDQRREFWEQARSHFALPSDLVYLDGRAQAGSTGPLDEAFFTLLRRALGKEDDYRVSSSPPPGPAP
jgi:sugar/nucleoside kinase (ribokinase family)